MFSLVMIYIYKYQNPCQSFCSTEQDQRLDNMQHKLPKHIWLSFDFEDSHPVLISSHLHVFIYLSSHSFLLCVSFSLFVLVFQDLPVLYLQGGSIIPLGPSIQHVGEAKPTDDLSLLVALDENGNFNFLLVKVLGL